MDNEFTRFIASLNTGSFLRLIMTVVLTTASVLMAYGTQMGYRLLIGCNIVTIAGAFILEYKSYKAKKDDAGRKEESPSKKKKRR